MKILVIKQTSLGDVLHSTGMIRAIKAHYPQAELTLLTSISCQPIYAHNPHVDRIITIDRDQIKQRWRRDPGWVWQHVKRVLVAVRQSDYDLAIDLQGLAKSVLFLYAAKARQKFVKGRWPGLRGFSNKSLHAIEEMRQVLKLAGIETVPGDVQMEVFTTEEEQDAARQLANQLGAQEQQMILLSPFTRWASKNWALDQFITLAHRLGERPNAVVCLSGAPEDAEKISTALAQYPTSMPPNVHNIAGALSLPALAELMRQAELVVTGDSFPMHLASAVNTPVVALFGPTDADKTGPLGNQAQILHAPDCRQCDRPNCASRCLAQLPVETVLDASLAQLGAIKTKEKA